MDLNTKVHIGTGTLYWIDAAAKDEIGLRVDDKPLRMYEFMPLARRVGHLFVRRGEAARSTLGRGIIIFTKYGIRLNRRDTPRSSGLYLPHLAELVPDDNHISAPTVELYFHPAGKGGGT